MLINVWEQMTGVNSSSVLRLVFLCSASGMIEVRGVPPSLALPQREPSQTPRGATGLGLTTRWTNSPAGRPSRAATVFASIVYSLFCSWSLKQPICSFHFTSREQGSLCSLYFYIFPKISTANFWHQYQPITTGLRRGKKSCVYFTELACLLWNV